MIDDNDGGGHDGMDSFNFKLKLMSKNKEYVFFARTKLERSLWYQNFDKAINFIKDRRDFNATSISWTTD